MRIPFVPKDIEINQDRYDFIKEYRGGGFMLMAGSAFWLMAFILTYVLPDTVIGEFYLWGGLLIPLFGWLLFKVMRMSAEPNQYSSLVGFASSITAVCIPVLLLVKELDPYMLLAVLCIINAAHLVILCWVHLDYLYFILVMLGVSLGFLFINTIPEPQVHFLALIWGFISLVTGVIIHSSTQKPLTGYDFSIKE
ncbi:DUF7010 family protein [Phocicoccus pinnipedialis]|uniref:Uncharacterized protein n=1 Tax=Phocicoccus pinnipedialis TaxID=110845 RepID=A0A6V7R8P4_9BACL|nr:hypothetical protein [Jeotgalicoccus pinnipedialis]MBP1940144.1 putative membrane protein YqgA involved in biofilm formation [Jeotgalicoccus pinnipedialis]CAD2073731.1 hypothetical protein JEOPIN946_00726 [Jeotgalicoccus pinnipedialis]